MNPAETRRLIRFGLVGALNTAVDAACFFLLRSAGFFVVGSQALAWAAGTANSYLFNSRWTFREVGGGKARLLRFVLVNVVSLGGSEGAIMLALLAMPEWAAKACSIAVSMTLNYLGQRFWVFRLRAPKDPGTVDVEGERD